MIQEVKKSLKFLETKEKKQLVNLSITKFLSGLMDLIGVASIIPFLAVISNQQILDSNLYLINLKEFLNIDNNQTIIILALVSFLVLVLNYLIRWFDIWYDAYVSHNIWLNLSKRLFNQYLVEPYSFYLENSTNNLLEKVQVKINYIVIGIIHPFFQICGKFFSSALLFSILLIVEPFITSSITLIILIFYFFVFLFLKNKMSNYGKQQADASTKSFKIVDQAFKSIKDIKLNNSYNFYIKNFFNISGTLANVSVKKIFFISSPKIIIELMTYLLAFGIIIYSMLVDYSSLSEIILLIGIYTITLHRILPNAQVIFQEIGNYKYYKPSFDEIFKDLGKNKPNNINIKKSIDGKFNFNKKLNLKNINYAYPNNKNKVLITKDVLIKKGEYTGITGSSGSGKSTFINLITALLNPKSGKVLIDGIEINSSNMKKLQSLIAYVPQFPFIADDTILNNIAYGMDQNEINLKRAKEAAKISKLSEFIENKLPLNYQTKVGEDGIRLSGGQKQRLSIARAIYADKDILIMDESTSSLDTVTERQIIDSILKFKSNKTIIFVTHRVHSLENCDKILILKEGMIESEGTYQYLKNNSNTFKKLLNKKEIS